MSVARPTSDRQSFWSLIPYAAVLFLLHRSNPPIETCSIPAVPKSESTKRADAGPRADQLGGSRNDPATHGRQATSPWEIPWSGWKDIFWRTYTEIGDDRLLAVAAGVVFYALLAIFPAITAIVSIYGLFSDAA